MTRDVREAASLLVIAVGVCLGAQTPQSHSMLLTLPQRDTWRSTSDSPPVSLSPGGRWIAFESYVRLAPADTNNECDIYVLDRTSGRVTLESLTTDGDLLSGGSSGPRVSRDGRFLVFQTALLSRDGTVVGTAIALRDRVQQTTRWVSHSPSGTLLGGASRHATISDDGRFVGFASSVTDLVAGRDENGTAEDVYLFEVETGRTRRVSVDTRGVQLPEGASFAPSISGDGRYVAFTSTARLDGSPPRSAAGRPLASIYVRDTKLDVTERVSLPATGNAADGHSSDPAISADGRYVAFASEASNLQSRDRNGSTDIFLTDLRAHAAMLISAGASGGSANGPSRHPIVSGNGRFVVFQSLASDLLCARHCDAASEDINLLWDVFRFDRLTGLMARMSAGDRAGWPEESSSPQIDADGGIVAFTSRHPIDAEDLHNDFDLFVRIGAQASAVTRPRQ